MSNLAEDPAQMRLYKELLDKTETELYIIEGGVPQELIDAREAELRTIKGEVLSVDDKPVEGPSSEVELSQPSLVGKDLLELEDVIAKLEAIKQKASDDTKKRWEAYSLRIQGFSVSQVAEQFGISIQLVYKYWEWCSKQLPEVKEYLDEFVNLSVQRLEAQYRQLAIARAKGDLFAHKVSADIIDQQGKLLGAHKLHVDVDTKVTYKLVGVDMDEL